MADLRQYFQHWAKVLSDEDGTATIVRIKGNDCLYEYNAGVDVFRGWFRDGESASDIVWRDKPVGGWSPELSNRGGPRPGVGRKPGGNWNGSGTYQRKIRRLSIGLTQAEYDHVEAKAEGRGISMSAWVAELIVAACAAG